LVVGIEVDSRHAPPAQALRRADAEDGNLDAHGQRRQRDARRRRLPEATFEGERLRARKLPADNLHGVAIGDLDADGRPDIVITTKQTHNVFVYLSHH
jgi:hypothetical protein